MNHDIHQSPLTPELYKRILEGFSESALENTGNDGYKEKPISFEIRNGEDFVGTVVVQLVWGQLHIKFLFVEKKFRNQGIATRLMQHALEFGRSKNCQFAFVETMSYQAPEFYKKMGFEIDFIRHGFANGTSFYFFKKDLCT